MLTLREASGRVSLTLTAQRLGLDLSVCLFGGDVPHIGAVAVAQPRPSLRNAEENSASCSVITLTGHKEDEPARATALFLAQKLNVAVTVACGIHLHDITLEEIREVMRLCGTLAVRCADEILTG